MILKKWNYKKHNYEDYEIPNNWKVKTYSEYMEEKINCVQCGKVLKIANCYTSLEVHTDMGFGYGVCEKCYEKEWQRRKKINEKDADV